MNLSKKLPSNWGPSAPDPKHFGKDLDPDPEYQDDPDQDPYLFLERLESTCVLQIFNIHINMYYMFISRQDIFFEKKVIKCIKTLFFSGV